MWLSFNAVFQPLGSNGNTLRVMDLLGLNRQITCCWQDVPSCLVRTRHEMFIGNSDLLFNTETNHVS